MRRNTKLMIVAGVSQTLKAPIEFPCDGWISNVEIQMTLNNGASPLQENPFTMFFGDATYNIPVLDSMILGNTEQLEIEADMRRRGFLLKWNQAMFRLNYETAAPNDQVLRYFVIDPVKRYKPWSMFVKKGKRYSLKALSDGEEPFQELIMKFAFSPVKGSVWSQKYQTSSSFTSRIMIPYDMKNAEMKLDYYLAETAAEKDVRLVAHIIRKGMGDETNFADAHDVLIHGATDDFYTNDPEFPYQANDIVLDYIVHGPTNQGFAVNDIMMKLGNVKAGDIVKFQAFDITANDGTAVTSGQYTSIEFNGIIAKDYYCKEGVFMSLGAGDVHNINLNDMEGFLDV